MNWSVPKIWQGGDVWILGGGPSVTKLFHIPQDVIDRVRQGNESPSIYSPYMESIHNKHVIGINVAYLIGDWIDMVFFGDNGFFLKHKDALEAWPGLKLCCSTGTGSYSFIKFLMKDTKKAYGISANPKMVGWNGNSGAASISVAANAGAKRIFLLGFDMTLDETNSQHWHSLYRGYFEEHNLKPRQRKTPFHRHLIGFKTIAVDAKQRGIQIINVCPTSAITEFPKVTLEEALKM